MKPRIASNAHKYRNKPTVVEGIQFHSKKEANRYCELFLLQKAKKISDLRPQPSFDLFVCGSKICKYIADFQYVENGLVIVEDVKSTATATPVYKLKKKLMKAVLKIEIRET
jgi:hypothetical protein